MIRANACDRTYIFTAVFFAAMLLCAPALAGTGVTVTTDRNSMAVGETLTVEIVMEGEFDDVTGPAMPDFQVVGRSSGSSFSMINGKVSRQQRLTFAVTPTKAGTLTIGKVELLKNKKVISSSAPVKISISGDGQAPSVPTPAPFPVPGSRAGGPASAGQEPPADPQARQNGSSKGIPARLAGKKAFIMARLPDRTVYAGEPVFLEYVLYTRSDLRISGLGLNRLPELNEFIVENASDGTDQTRIVALRNRRYQERVVWRSAVTAIEPGEAIIDPISVNIVTGDMFSRRRYTLESEPVKVNFKNVPARGRPADYIPGTIGTFIVNASLDKPVVKVGESAVLTVEIAGSGNLRALKPPRITESDGLRLDRVPSSDLDEMRVDRGGVSGRKVFQYVLTPRKEGEFELGRIDVPYFSNVSGTFERARSEKIKITAAGFSLSGRTVEARREVPRLGIIGESSLTPPEPPEENMISATALAAAMFAPVLFFGAVETWWRRRAYLSANSRTIMSRKALRKAKAAVRQLEKQSPQGAGFWDLAEEIIRDFLDERFDIRAAAMTPVELSAALGRLSAAPDAIRQLVNELESCAFARFAPSGTLDGDRNDAIQRITRCLTALDRSGKGGDA